MLLIYSKTFKIQEEGQTEGCETIFQMESYLYFSKQLSSIGITVVK